MPLYHQNEHVTKKKDIKQCCDITKLDCIPSYCHKKYDEWIRWIFLTKINPLSWRNQNNCDITSLVDIFFDTNIKITFTEKKIDNNAIIPQVIIVIVQHKSNDGCCITMHIVSPLFKNTKCR